MQTHVKVLGVFFIALSAMGICAAIFFLVGFLPTWLIMRAKLWACRRRIEALERTRLAPVAERDTNEQEPAA